MKKTNLLLSSILSLTFFAEAHAIECKKLIQLDLGFNVGTTGAIHLKIAESKYQAVEATINALAHIKRSI